jgi:hypothetical protein
MTLPLQQLYPTIPATDLVGGCSAQQVVDTPVGPVGDLVTLPLTGESRTYPNDWLEGRMSLTIQLPPDLYIVGVTPYSGIITHVPTDLRVVKDRAVDDFAQSVVQTGSATPVGPTSADVATFPPTLQLVMYRDWTRPAIVYSAIISVSLALILMLWHALFVSTKHRDEALHNLLFNVFVTIVTVAAVRQLLVPGELQGEATRVDIILALMSSLLLAIVCLAYACRLAQDVGQPIKQAPVTNPMSPSRDR